MSDAPTRHRKPGQKYLLISAVAERFDIHPQTLRLYEREGLLTPARSKGNTRLYDDEALRRLETILTLTRDLGVNLAGVEVILNLRGQLREMQLELDRLLDRVRHDLVDKEAAVARKHALVRLQAGLPVRRAK